MNEQSNGLEPMLHGALPDKPPARITYRRYPLAAGTVGMGEWEMEREIRFSAEEGGLEIAPQFTTINIRREDLPTLITALSRWHAFLETGS